MNKILFTALAIFLFSLMRGYSTTILEGQQAEKYINGASKIILNDNSNIPAFIQYKDESNPVFDKQETWLKMLFGLSNKFGIKLIASENDRLGYTHYRYVQTYNGITLDGTMWIFHVRGDKVVSMNGLLIDQLKIVETGALTETEALNKALDFIHAELYKWQIPAEEALLRRMTNDPAASYFPKGEMTFAYDSRIPGKFNYRLTYRFDIYSEKPFGRKYVFVDANSGSIVDVKERIQEVNKAGTAVTGYAGTQPIVTDSVNATMYRLRENGRGAGQGMETYNMQGGTSFAAAVDFTDDDNYWNNVNPNKDQYATDAHFAAEKTYDYYYTNYGRNSINNAGMKLLSYVHYSVNYVNAFWDGTRMTYGDGNATYTPLTSLDIGGHEITHGLTEYTAGLNYAYESGALNESFSDCFGTAVEWYSDPAHADWLIGEDIGSPFRSHSNPNAYGDPDTYQGQHWYTGTGDNGGVHTNSGVQNFWFYLLSVGGSGTNDIGNGYSVSGIGIVKAAAIAFRTLTVYLTQTSQYIDARNYSIQSAIDLYGNCSPEMYATIEAWYAVGVGGGSNIPTTITNAGPLTFCQGENVVLNASAPYGSTYTWYKNGVLINGSTGSQYTAATGGTYDVITNSCGVIDTSNSLSVTVIALAPAIIPSGNATGCDSVLLTAANTAGYNVQWNKNGVPVVGATFPTYRATASGDYSVTLSASYSTAQTFSNNTVISIPDNTCQLPAISTIAVTGLPLQVNPKGIKVTVNITHTWDGDLILMLEAPNGDMLGLSKNAGGSGDNFINTVFSDSGTGSLSTGTAPFTGVFLPWPVTFSSCTSTNKTSFASIGNGTINPNGNWKLHVYDQGPADLGTINNWNIYFPAISNPFPDCSPATSPSTNVSIGNKAKISMSPNPVINYQFTGKNNFSGTSRAFGVSASINGKGYYGLGTDGNVSPNDWWEYDPQSDTWAQKSNCPIASNAACGFSIGNTVYVVGGQNGGYLNSVYEWSSTGNNWTLKNPFPGGSRAFASASRVGSKGYLIGGINSANTYSDIWEYDPSSDLWTFKATIPGAFGRSHMVSFESEGNLFFGLGTTCGSPCGTSQYSGEWFLYDPFTNTVSQRTNFPGSTRENASSFTFNDDGYVGFGNQGSSNYADVWKYNSVQDNWTQVGTYSGSGLTGVSASTIDNAVYLFGGNDNSGPTKNVIEFKVLSNICTNNPASVSLQASGGNSYQWSTGASTQSISGISTGSYSVEVSNTGCSSKSFANVSIYPVPAATVSANGPLVFCSGHSVNLTSSAASSYLWSNGATTGTMTATESGNYSVTTTGAGGCTNTSAPVSVIAYPGPPVSIAGSSSLAICQGSSVDLNSYGFQQIPFSPVSGSGTQITLNDDQVSGALPIGFSFTFWANTYTNFYISSNGFITFGTSPHGCCTGQVLPNTNSPNNLISFAWNDLYPPAGGSIEYFTTGTAPNRKLVVKFNTIQHWPGGNPVTAQVILFETSNLIEIHTTSMPTNNTAHTMGIENSNGTKAIIYPGRNGVSWSATNDAVRFGTGISSYLWSTNATTPSIAASSAGSYFVTVTDANNCTATSSALTVSVNPLPNSTITAGGPTTFCIGDSVTLSANNSSAYLWSTGATTQSIKAYNTGNYSVTVTDANGCTKNSAPTSVAANPCSAPVNLKVYIQGFYKGSGTMEAVLDKVLRPTICDSVTLELHEIIVPYNLAYSVKGVIGTNGNGTFVFPLSALNNTYYLVVRHRNSLETWSALPVTLTAPSYNYDFSTSSGKSFGGNQIDLGSGVFGIYSGDINQDRSINSADFDSEVLNTKIFTTGYVVSDLTGDWIVESADISLIENNVAAAITVLRP